MVVIGLINFSRNVTQKVIFHVPQAEEKNLTKLISFCLTKAVVGFKCPQKVAPESAAARFWPFPRFPVSGDCHRLITCVEGYPRLITCGEDKVFDENTLTCEDPENVPTCRSHKK